MKKIIVTGMEQPEFKEISSSLKAIFNLEEQIEIKQQFFSSTTLEKDKGELFYVFLYTSIECFLAHKFEHQEVEPNSLQEAIYFWLECNSRILHFYNRNSERAILVNLETIDNDDKFAQLIEVSCSAFDLSRETKKVETEFCLTHYNEGELSLIKNIANQYTDESTSLYADMEAVADINFEHFSEYNSLLSTWNFINKKKANSRKSAELQSQVKDLTITNNNLQQVSSEQQQENENLYSNLHSLQVEIEDLNIKLHSAASNYHSVLLQKDDEIKSITNDKFRADKQVKIKSEALEETRKELRHFKWLSNKLEEESKELVSTIDKETEQKVQKQLNDAQSQVSIKSDALEETRKELRHFKWLSNKLEQENEDILKQLLVVQERFEELFDKNQQTANMNTEPDTTVENSNAITPLTSKQRKLRKLRSRPVLFVTDAFKNKIQSKKVAS
ncbi:hypothetical protein [Thalassotalea sp. Y01]|uniref:hypothetical protein n=1 Tax=Thalassotalea sp. Y01 TaxID=2729613 RepID=UPI00145E8933|nr:hypothetical protein [Thalassotalea sp. Y01]NMP14988.1 hypothetical protein [Thalassotalea sp. Y01]